MDRPLNYRELESLARGYHFDEGEIAGLRRVYEFTINLYTRTHKKPSDTCELMGYISDKFRDASGAAALYVQRVIDSHHETKP